MKAKKILKGVFIIVLLLVLIGLTMIIPIKPKWFSDEKHIATISKKVDRRYAERGTYAISPIVEIGAENPLSKIFLVEFDKGGFIFVCAKTTSLFLNDMYLRAEYPSGWKRYKLDLNQPALVYADGAYWKNSFRNFSHDYYYEHDEKGQMISQTNSPYKVAGVENEDKYLLRVHTQGTTGWIPAVKRGDKWLNLISLEEIEYKKTTEDMFYSYMQLPFYNHQTL